MFNELENLLVEKGFYDTEYNRYILWNDEHEEIEDVISDFFTKKQTQYKIHSTSGVETPNSYDSWVVSIAWIESEKLQLETIVVEYC